MDTWYGIQLNANGCVTCMDMDGDFNCFDDYSTGNNLSGVLPSAIGNLSDLIFLDLSANELSGSIPNEIGNLNNLAGLVLSNNQLSGNIPNEIGNLNNLTYLKLYNNQLSGCYGEDLINLCNQLPSSYNTNNYISNGNNFNAPWEDFCATGVGTCESVWPGDFNYDGIATESDMLHWGRAYGFSGLARLAPATDWSPQEAELWLQDIDGINSMHQDGNGDGAVDELDIDVLVQNFGQEHNFTAPLSLASTLVYELVRRDTTSGLYYDLYVTDGAENYISTHGISLVLNFGDIPIDEISMDTTGSSLQPHAKFELYDTLQNKFHIALTRTDTMNKECIGPIAGFVIIADDVPTGDPLEIMRLENGTEMQADGTMQNITDMSMYDTYPGYGLATDDISVGVSAQHTECGVAGSVTVTTTGGTPPYAYAWNTGANTSEITDLTAGIYEITVSDAADNVKILSVEIEGQYLPVYDAAGNLVDCGTSLCPTLITPNGIIDEGVYQAGTSINAVGTVDSNVEFKAGEMIILRNGFEVAPGAAFSGVIELCPDN